MSTKRRTLDRGKGGRLTPEIIAAWKRADFTALQLLCRLAPWEPSPFPYEIAGPLGCSEDDLPIDPEADAWEKSKPKVLEWQRQLLAVAGWPDCRHVYEEELRDAEASLKWACNRVENPPREQYCWIDKPEACRQALEDAIDQVEYRRKLLAGLTRVQKKWARRIAKTTERARPTGQ